MIIYFAGSESEHHNVVLHKCGVKNRLVNAYFLKYKDPIAPYRKFSNLIIDSGGVQSRLKGKSVSVEEYAEWLEANEIRLCFNLDMITIEESWKNQAYLEKRLPQTYIIPIFHATDKTQKGLEYFDAMIEEYPFIAVGGVAKAKTKKDEATELLDFVFSKTRDQVLVHGLGMTDDYTLKRYPFYSVDSTSWCSFFRFGSSKAIKDKKLRKVVAKNRHFTYLSEMEVNHWLGLQKFYSDLWQKRGIKFNDQFLRNYTN